MFLLKAESLELGWFSHLWPHSFSPKIGCAGSPPFRRGLGSIFSMSRGCFFKKLPISFPYRVTVRVGQRFTPGAISQVACQNAVMELGRLSFTERLKKKLLLKDLLNKQIFKRRDGLFFQTEDGTQILHTDFVRMVRGTARYLFI